MSYREKKIGERLSGELLRKERQERYLVKRSEESEALEAVFDKKTLMTVYSMMNRGILKTLNGAIRAGKEAKVYHGVRHDGKEVAVKIYYTVTASFKRRLPYLVGDPRFAEVQKTGHALIYEWVKKEFRNLRQAKSAGVAVPEPYACQKNVLVMEFIGRDGIAAPTLNEAESVDSKDYKSVLQEMVKLTRRAKLVHGDLSEFNVFKSDEGILLFDFASAVDLFHPMAKEFLLRDIRNINRFFAKKGVEVVSEVKILKRCWADEF
ncbi:MAG: serine protein kinase RIO [Conexivisphaerales archaeon]